MGQKNIDVAISLDRRLQWRLKGEGAPDDVYLSRAILQLPVDIDINSVNMANTLPQLWQHARVSELDKRLAVAWLLLPLIFPRSSIPMLVLHGEPGAAKATAAMHLISILDPAVTKERTLPDPDKDWGLVMGATRLVLLDNVHRINQKHLGCSLFDRDGWS